MFNTLFVAFQQRRVELETLTYDMIGKQKELTPEEFKAKIDSLSLLARSALKSTARGLRETDAQRQVELDQLIGALE